MTNDITILFCPQCGFPKIRDCGNGLYQCDDCGTHFDKSENIVLTEQEWLQTASTEQLAEWIVHIADQCTISHECNRCESWCDEKRVVEWLKEIHNE